jgi:L-threonylcarbamoyladenylate synthase
MRVLKINRTRVSKRALAEAAAVLRAGGVVVFPTETAYGLAADPRNAEAVREIFRIKGRSPEKSLPFVAASVAVVRKNFVIDPISAKLARRHWPGPITLVLSFKRRNRIAAATHEKTGAVRVPASAWARALACEAGGVVTSTSANLSGDATAYRGSELIRVFKNRRTGPALVLDAGALPRRAPSTIVRVRRGGVMVLRQGAVKV